MALFKISKGLSGALANQPKTEGYCWFTPDDGKFYIDAYIEENGEQVLKRVPLNALRAEQDVDGRNIKDTYIAHYITCTTSTVDLSTEATSYTATATFKDYKTGTIVNFADLSSQLENGMVIKCIAIVPGFEEQAFGVFDVSRFTSTEIAFSGLGYINATSDTLYQGYFTLNNSDVGSAIIKTDFGYIEKVDGVGTGTTSLEKVKVGNGCTLAYNNTTNCLTFSF